MVNYMPLSLSLSLGVIYHYILIFYLLFSGCFSPGKAFIRITSNQAEDKWLLLLEKEEEMFPHNINPSRECNDQSDTQ